MSEIPNDPIYQKKPLIQPKSSDATESKKSAPEKSPSLPLEDVVEISSSSKVSAKEASKVKKWVDILMQEDAEEDRSLKLQEAKENVKKGYANPSEVLKKTAEGILEDLGL